VRLERKEAVALLKEIVPTFQSYPSLVALRERGRGKYALVLIGDYNPTELRQLASKKHLSIDENPKARMCTIYTPKAINAKFYLKRKKASG
jgi:hypothetical protein